MYSTTHVESTGIYRIVLKQTGVLLATANCSYVSLTSVDPNQHNSDNAIALKHQDVCRDVIGGGLGLTFIE